MTSVCQLHLLSQSERQNLSWTGVPARCIAVGDIRMIPERERKAPCVSSKRASDPISLPPQQTQFTEIHENLTESV